MTVGSSARGSKPVRLLALHTTEGAMTNASLKAFFEREYATDPNNAGSSHAGIDDQGIAEFVPYDRAAWTLRSGNPISDNAEICGYAKWTRDEWLTTHANRVDNAARWLAARSTARGIPLVKLSPADVAAGESGVIGHVDWTTGMHDGSHTDPGAGFPWDVVIAKAIYYTQEHELDNNQAGQLNAVFSTASYARDYKAAPRKATDDVGGHVYQLRQDVDALNAKLDRLIAKLGA